MYHYFEFQSREFRYRPLPRPVALRIGTLLRPARLALEEMSRDAIKPDEELLAALELLDETDRTWIFQQCLCRCDLRLLAGGQKWSHGLWNFQTNAPAILLKLQITMACQILVRMIDESQGEARVGRSEIEGREPKFDFWGNVIPFPQRVCE